MINMQVNDGTCLACDQEIGRERVRGKEKGIQKERGREETKVERVRRRP